jgi:hypothetical protein
MNILKISAFAIRITLSVFVLALAYGFVSVAQSFLGAIIFPMPPPTAIRGRGVITSSPSLQNDAPVKRLWPPYPGAHGHPISEMTINGVRTQCEEWEVSAAPDQVLEYYRHQMLARGWKDVTGESFGMEMDGSPAAPQLDDTDVMLQYARIMENSLVLTRGRWTLHVAVSDGSRPWKTTSRLFAAETPDIRSLLTRMREGADGEPFVAEEDSGNFTYRTSISKSTKNPREALDERMKSLGISRWQVVASPRLPTKTLMAIGSEQRRPGNVYVFARNGQERHTTEVITTEVFSHE